MNCIIIDDDEACRTVLEQMIGHRLIHSLIQAHLKQAGRAVNALKNNDTNLVFFDVEMSGMNGIEMLRELVIKPLVMLRTLHKEYALDAYEHEAVDYLVKPITLSRFLKTTSKAERRLEIQF